VTLIEDDRSGAALAITPRANRFNPWMATPRVTGGWGATAFSARGSPHAPVNLNSLIAFVRPILLRSASLISALSNHAAASLMSSNG